MAILETAAGAKDLAGFTFSGLIKSYEWFDNNAEAKRHNTVGDLLNKKGQKGAALQAYKKAAELKRNKAELHDRQALEYRSQNQYWEVQGEHELAVRRKPRVARYHCNYAVTLFFLDDNDKALDELRKAVKCARKDEIASCRSLLIHFLVMTGRHSEAVREAESATEDTAELHYSKALAFSEDEDRRDDALDEANRAIHMEPGESWYYHLRCMIHWNKNELELAREDAQRMLNLNRDNVLYHLCLSELLDTMDKPKEALESAITAAELTASADHGGANAVLCRKLACHLKNLNKPALALEVAKRAVDTAKGSKDAALHYELAVLLRSLGDAEAALDEARKAVKSDKGVHASYHLYLADILYELNHTEESLVEAKFAEEAAKESIDTELYCCLPYLQYSIGGPKSPWGTVEKGTVASTWYHLYMASILYELGESDQALAEAKLVVEWANYILHTIPSLPSDLIDSDLIDIKHAKFKTAEETELNNKYAELLFHLSLLLHQMGDNYLALDKLRDAACIAKTIKDKKLFEKIDDCARDMAGSASTLKALEASRKAKDLYADALRHFRMGEGNEGNINEARIAARQAAKAAKDIENVWLHYEIADLLYLLDVPKEALAEARLVVRKAEKFDDACLHYCLSFLFADLKKPKEALTEFDNMLNAALPEPSRKLLLKAKHLFWSISILNKQAKKAAKEKVKLSQQRKRAIRAKKKLAPAVRRRKLPARIANRHVPYNIPRFSPCNLPPHRI